MLLLGFVVVSVVVPGSLLLSGFLDDATGGPPVELRASYSSGAVVLSHEGGRALRTDEVTVVLRGGDGRQSRSRLASWTLPGSGGSVFQPSEYATRGGWSRPVTVVVVHAPTESVLLDETLRIADATTTTTPPTSTTTPPTSTTTPGPNSPPTASFSRSCAGVDCSFDGTGSSDPDGSIASYEWAFGDGNADTGGTATNAYSGRGTYTVTLTVTDDDGATDTTSQQVDVVPYRPALSGVVVDDRTGSSGADYRVSYDVDNTTEFRNVAVEFDNRANDWSDATRTNTGVRGYVAYSRDGTDGDTFDITVLAYDLTGTVTDSVTISDTADGDDSSEGNLSSPGGPAFAGVVVDDTSAAEASYEVSYNVTNRSEFGQVEVEVRNLDRDWATATYTSSDPRHNVEGYDESTYGDSYRITLDLVDSTGATVESVVVTDTADGTDPPGNDDLSRPRSPALSNWAVSDDSSSSEGAAFDATYSATTTAEFGEVEVIFRNRDSRSASETATAAGASGTLSHRAGGADGDQYEVEIRVVDSDGIVVDEVSASDVADGTDPGGNPPSSPSDPAFAGVAVDDASVTGATYEVSYNVTNRGRFDHVAVEVENLDTGSASATYTSTDPRHNVDDYGESTFGDSYRITVRAVDDAGFTTDEMVVTDTADGTDPGGSDDLSRAGSPALSSYTVTDRSPSWGSEYEVQYAATDTGEFAGVEVIFRNRDSQYASEVRPVSGSPTGTFTHEAGGTGGNQYEIEIRIIDADGIVVDEVIVTDVADGTDP